MMSTVRKYANLPDLDLAPDVYETPELTDDNSTIPTSNTHRSESPHSQYSEHAGDDADGIVRQRIHQDEARSRFLSEDERRAISPSRVGDKRRAHQGFEKARKTEIDGLLNGVVAGSDEDQEESVARKLARLRREIIELQTQIQQEKGDASTSAKGLDKAGEAEAGSLVALLDAAETSHTKHKKSAATRLLDRVGKDGKGPVSSISRQVDGSTNTIENASTEEAVSGADDSAASLVARLDARLQGLEDLLGLDAVPTHGPEGIPIKPLLPALDALDKQYTTLATTSETSIEKIRDRVRELANDASTLEMKRSQAKKAFESLTTAHARSRSRSGTLPDGAPKIGITEDHEQILKINALYGTLGTIDSVAPVLPSVLERLRSLRDLHANAANASQNLLELEREQQELKEDLRLWKGGVERVEKAVFESQGTLKENTEVVEEWVQELEQRLKDLQ